MKTRSFSLAAVFVAFVFGLMSPMASAQILNVPSVAFPTIQSAVDAAVSGDTIMIAAGTFTSAGGGPGVVNVVGKMNITIMGSGTTATIIDAQQTFTSGFFVESSPNITIRELTVREMNRHGIISFNSPATTIEDVRAQGLGIATVSTNGVIYGFGILNSPNSSVDAVTIEDCSGGGFQFTGGSIACSLSNFSISNSAGVPGFAAIAFDTAGGISIPGGDVGVDISGANFIIGTPSGFLFLDTPLGTITTTLTGTTSFFGVIAEVTTVGLGTIVGLNDYITGLSLMYVLSNASAAVPTGLAYFSSLANAAIGVALAPNPETAVLTELGTSTIFVAPGMNIQAAVDAAGMNGVVCILPGVYSTVGGNEIVNITQDGLTLKGTDRDTVILDSQSTHNLVIVIDGALDVTVSDLTMTGADRQHLEGIDADGLTVSNVRVAGLGNMVQGVNGRIHGFVLNTDSSDVLVEDVIASDLSGSGVQFSPGTVGILRSATLQDVAGNIGFGAISVFVAGSTLTPDGNSSMRLEGATTIGNTIPGGVGILLGDAGDFVLELELDNAATVTFTNIIAPLARFGEGCVPLLDDTAVSMGLPWRVTGGEPLAPNGAAYFADEATATIATTFATNPLDTVVTEVFAEVFPGSREDFEMLIFINGLGTGQEPMKNAQVNTDVITVEISTPCGTFVNAPAILAVQLWQGVSPPGNVIFPIAHLQTQQAIVLYDGSPGSPFGSSLLTSQPLVLNYIAPVGLIGVVGRIQAFVLSGLTDNMIFGASNAQEVTFTN
ncbi:MAG: right-handed parallel beta-helix repeat-containing protein [Planctomycetota bacterium]